MKSSIVAILLIISISLILEASDFPGAEFLQIYPGARAAGLAGAFSAIVDDGMATYYNPAGLAFQRNISILINHCNWLAGLCPGSYYEYATATLPIIKNLTIAPMANFVWFGSYWNDFLQQKLYCYDLALGVSAGMKVFPFLGIGATFKYIYSQNEDYSYGISQSTAFDFGLLPTYNWSLGKTNTGLAIQNIGNSIKFKDIGVTGPLPRAIRMGLAHNISVKNLFSHVNLKNTLFEQANIIITYDIRKLLVRAKEPFYSIGFEINPFPLLSLRIGYFEDISGQRGGILVNRRGYAEHIALFDYLFTKNHGKYEGKIGLCYGIGIKYKGFAFDAGNDGMIYDFATTNWRLSASYTF